MLLAKDLTNRRDQHADKWDFCLLKGTNLPFRRKSLDQPQKNQEGRPVQTNSKELPQLSSKEVLSTHEACTEKWTQTQNLRSCLVVHDFSRVSYQVHELRVYWHALLTLAAVLLRNSRAAKSHYKKMGVL